MALNLLHLADIHFGMENYGRLDPATGLNRRLLDFSRSVHHAIDYALEHDVHLAVFAGDIYKHRDPDPSWQREFARCVRRLVEDIRVPAGGSRGLEQSFCSARCGHGIPGRLVSPLGGSTLMTSAPISARVWQA